MTSVKSWVAVATLVAVILGAFATGGALARIARLQKAQADGMRMDQAADLNRSVGAGETPAPAEGTTPAPASAFGADYGVTPDGGLIGGAEGDLIRAEGDESGDWSGGFEGDHEEDEEDEEDEHFGGRFRGRHDD